MARGLQVLTFVMQQQKLSDFENVSIWTEEKDDAVRIPK
jgi:hypothetical protein